jgi:phosphoribosylanthranilate isomerase
MMVKVCGITNLDDALAAADGGATALDFNFYSGSPRYITPESAAAIIERLPAGVWNVGVFVNESRVVEIARIAGLDVVQLHGDEPPSAIPTSVRAWKAFRVTESFAISALEAYPTEAVLLDGPAPGTGQGFDWTLAASSGQKIILAGGLDDCNVKSAIEAVRPWGVDACSRLEISPGRKDHAKLSRFLKAAL